MERETIIPEFSTIHENESVKCKLQIARDSPMTEGDCTTESKDDNPSHP